MSEYKSVSTLSKINLLQKVKLGEIVLIKLIFDFQTFFKPYYIKYWNLIYYILDTILSIFNVFKSLFG